MSRRAKPSVHLERSLKLISKPERWGYGNPFEVDDAGRLVQCCSLGAVWRGIHSRLPLITDDGDIIDVYYDLESVPAIRYLAQAIRSNLPVLPEGSHYRTTQMKNADDVELVWSMNDGVFHHFPGEEGHGMVVSYFKRAIELAREDGN